MKMWLLFLAPCATDICVENYAEIVAAISTEHGCKAIAQTFIREEPEIHAWCEEAHE